VAETLRRSLLPLCFALALVLLGAGALLLSSTGEDGPGLGRVGGDVPVNAEAVEQSDFTANNTPSLARHPTDPRQLALVNRIDEPAYACALHRSGDGGATWARVDVRLPPGASTCYAPDVTFGAGGDLHVSFVTLSGRGNVPDGLWVARIAGRRASPPVRVSGRLAFQARLAADPAAPGRLYAVWLQASDVGLFRFTAPGNPIVAARSEDRGRTWSPPVRVSRSGRARVLAPEPAVAPGGELLVLHLDVGDDRLDYEGAHEARGGPPHPGPWQLVLARSGDRGATWSETVVDARLRATERFVAFLPPFPSLAVHRGGQRVHAAFQDGALGDADVVVWTSEDGGETFGPRRRVNDTPERDGTEQYRPRLALGGDRLDVVYYDRRDDPRNVMNHVSLQSSDDGGESFGPRLRLSGRPFDSRIGFGSERGLADIGSRLALLSTEDRALAAWTDTRAAITGSPKQDIVRAAAAFSSPRALSRPVEVVLRFGGLVAVLAGLLLAVAVTGRRRPVGV
jgi:hypothetical protein